MANGRDLRLESADISLILHSELGQIAFDALNVETVQ
jgi:hypothetical protein